MEVGAEAGRAGAVLGARVGVVPGVRHSSRRRRSRRATMAMAEERATMVL
jgi:hypothetical protein